ncbi:ATP-binding protein [Xanthobacter sp. V2C-8]|uniref:AlbA family DNA-binding domain-containing protein n=1 Tax=Xanthobacter albus TaxID=3119929 RepID=UPI00372C25DB
MAKRSISDSEIGLIKSMLAKGMKNKDIQFYFNRPDRAVNSGRVSQIKTGSYGPEVPPASTSELDVFLSSHTSTTILRETSPLDPFANKILDSMFTECESKAWRLKCGETDIHECKTSFGFKHCGEWIRAVAALSNNKGGYIFFGAHDKDTTNCSDDDGNYLVVGLKNDIFSKADPAEFTRIIRSNLDPTPTVRTTTVRVGGRTVGVMHVEQHPSRPVIVRNGDGTNTLKEGDIFFRYPGRSERIKYSDLRSMLDERDLTTRSSLIPMISRIISLGPDRTMIADLDNQVIGDSSRPIFIDQTLAEQLKFIKEGSFSETEGAPALRLVGDVTISDKSDNLRKTVRMNLSPDAVLRNFLSNDVVQEPLHYILHSAHSTREWQPIWYYLKLSGLSASSVIDHLKKEVASRPSHQSTTIERLEGKKSAYYLNRGKPQIILRQILADELELPTDDIKAQKFALAIQGLSEKPKNINDIRSILLSCYERATSQSPTHKALQSAVFRAACRLDELLYKEMAEE